VLGIDGREIEGGKTLQVSFIACFADVLLLKTYKDRIMKINGKMFLVLTFDLKLMQYRSTAVMEEQLKGILAILGKTYSLPPELQMKTQSAVDGDGTSSPPPYTCKEGSTEQDPPALEGYQNASMTRVKALEEAIRLAHLAKVSRLASEVEICCKG
jgi:hypothetical protein